MRDRQQLLAALGEYKRGKAPPLLEGEFESIVASLEERIAKLDAMIAEADEA